MVSLRSLLASVWPLVDKHPWRTNGVFFTLLGLLVYAGMPASELTFDNAFIIGDDTRLRSFNIESIRLILAHDYWWPSLISSAYRPLTTFSFLFEYSFLGYGESPFGYQLANLFLHICCTLLTIAIARQLGLGSRHAFAVGCVFFLHPISTEVVANIVGRSDLLACLAVLGGLFCYFKGLEENVSTGRMRWFMACGACGVLGVLAKENAAALPALVAWNGLCRWREFRGEQSRRRVWLSDAWQNALCLLPCVVLIILVRKKFGGLPGMDDNPFIDNPLMPEGFISWQLSAFGIWGMQLKTLLWPLSLSSDYSFDAVPVARWSPTNATFWWGVGTLVMFASGGVALLAGAKRWPGAVFLIGSYVIAMLPTSNVLMKIGSIRADRFNYLPAAFLWTGLTIMLLSAARDLAIRSPIVSEALRRRGVVALIAWCASLAVLSHVRCYDWQSNLTLWQSAVDAAPGSVKAQAAVSNERVRLRNDAQSALDALVRIERALVVYVEKAVDPADWPLMLFSDYGAFRTTLFDELSKKPDQKDEAKSHLAEGLKWLRKGLSHEHAMRVRWSNRWSDGDADKAPVLEALHRNYALALQRNGEPEAAIKEIDWLIEKRLFKAELRELRAKWLLDMGKVDEAADELMLVSVMMKESTAFVQLLASSIKKIEPSAQPLARDSAGVWRLDVSDGTVRKLLEKACRRYIALLKDVDDAPGVSRFIRTARHVYGVELREENRR